MPSVILVFVAINVTSGGCHQWQDERAAPRPHAKRRFRIGAQKESGLSKAVQLINDMANDVSLFVNVGPVSMPATAAQEKACSNALISAKHWATNISPVKLGEQL